MAHKIARFGWIPDRPDQRDHRFTEIAPPSVTPCKIDLEESGYCPPVWDQGQLGSCTGNGIAGCFGFDLKKQGLLYFSPSRLFIYYNERVIEGTVEVDSGAQIRDGIKSIAQFGVPSETLWPYDIAQFATKPPQNVFDEAAKNKAVLYQSVNQDLASMRGTLASGFPIVFGMSVYESFDSDAVAQTGIVPMPGTAESEEGGHCMYLIGYDDNTRLAKSRNSWSPEWGDKGNCYIPYEYLTSTDLASDFWVIRVVQ